MGRRVSFVNDIQILEQMLSPVAKVMLQPGQGRPSVELSDLQSGTSVEIKGLPDNSIVIRAEDFTNPLSIFNGTMGECKRADFVIVTNDDSIGKWIVCIETQEMDSKLASHVIQQLKGAYCFISYCKCIGKYFWEFDEFLNDYEFRFVSIVDINFNISRRRTEPFVSKGKPHDDPKLFLKISRRSKIYFRKLIDFVP